MQKPMTCPPVWRWRFTFPSPSTLRRLIQRPVARSNLKGLNQTLSPWGTQGNSSLWTAMSGSPIAAMTCSVRSSAKAFSSPSPKACSLARYRAAFNSVRRSVITQVLGLVLRGVDELDRAPVIARLAGGVGLLLEFGLDLHRGSQAIGRDREVERSRAADVWRGHGGARREHRAAAQLRREDPVTRRPEVHARAVVAVAGLRTGLLGRRRGRDYTVVRAVAGTRRRPIAGVLVQVARRHRVED